METKRILAVDDESDILEAYTKVLTPETRPLATEDEMENLAAKLFGDSPQKQPVEPFHLTVCSQGEDAVQAVERALKQNKPFSVAFIDIRLPPGHDGVWTAEKIRKMDPHIEIVMVTAYSDIAPSRISSRVPPSDKLLYVQKPFHPQEILQFAIALSTKWQTDALLRKTQMELEERVKARTKALSVAKKNLEEEVALRKQAHAELNQVFKAAVPLCVIDKHFNMIRVNETFCTFFQIPEQHILNKKCYEALQSSLCHTRACPLAQILDGAERTEHEEEKKLPDGKMITCVLTAIPFRGPGNELIGIVENFTDITERKLSEQALKKREAELAQKSRHLEDANAALRTLLRQRDEQRKEIEEKVLSNVKDLVLPHLESLKKSMLNPAQQEHLRVLESSLTNLISPFSQALSSAHMKLTPREIQVANLVKAGRTSKEIAGMLNVSTNAVVFHRYNIRKKLGLQNKKTNLRSYLSSLP